MQGAVCFIPQICKKKEEKESYGPVAKLVVDNDENGAKILEAKFDEDWGDWLYLHDIFIGDTKKEHIVEITLTNETEGKEFYLASIIAF
jgi:hypothetical protein